MKKTLIYVSGIAAIGVASYYLVKFRRDYQAKHPECSCDDDHKDAAPCACSKKTAIENLDSSAVVKPAQTVASGVSLDAFSVSR